MARLEAHRLDLALVTVDRIDDPGARPGLEPGQLETAHRTRLGTVDEVNAGAAGPLLQRRHEALGDFGVNPGSDRDFDGTSVSVLRTASAHASKVRAPLPKPTTPMPPRSGR
ncbi:MAG: hypothetical protein U0U69_02195 [Acidimicrobiia bacterium]